MMMENPIINRQGTSKNRPTTSTATSRNNYTGQQKGTSAKSSLDDQLEFDYHIEFPTICYEEDSSDLICQTRPDKKDVLIILLGWAGAHDKHLAKYSDIYLKRGCIVLRYITPVKFLFKDSSKLPIIGARIVQLIKELQLESHPTFFHIFSNGGTMQFSNILKELAAQQDDFKIDFRGTILDSAPAPRNMVIMFKALIGILGTNKFRHLLAGLIVLFVICKVFWGHFKAALRFCVFGDKLDNLAVTNRGRLEDESPLNWLRRISHMRDHNFLFIYSPADHIMPYKEIEKFGEILKGRKNNVQMLKFEDSPHVQHYRSYPKEYIDTVKEFIQQTMKQDTKNKTILWRE